MTDPLSESGPRMTDPFSESGIRMTDPLTQSSVITMGINDQFQCLDGWFIREIDGPTGVCCRWTGHRASFRILLPQQATALRILMSGPSTATGRPASFSLYYEEQRMAHLASPCDSWFWTVAKLPLNGLPDATRDQLQVFTLCSEREPPDAPGTFEPNLFVPDHYLHNGDSRSMGIRVAGIRAG